MTKLEEYKKILKDGNYDKKYISIICKGFNFIRKKHKKELFGEEEIPHKRIIGKDSCLICNDQSFNYWISSYNGHIGFECSNPECGFNAQQ